MFRRFLRHKVIRDKGLLLIFAKPPLFPRLLPGTFVGNVMNGQERGRRPASRIRLVLRLLTGGLADAPLVSTISKYSEFPARRSDSSVATQLRRDPPRRDQP